MATVAYNFACTNLAGPQSAGNYLPPRLVPDAPLPPYSYVPGRFPHPIRDPQGHSHGEPPARAAEVDPARWRASRDYLLGCDLFNHGYYWEAHEAWEAAWHACGRRGPAADFLKGLIKLAAAGVKVREARTDGVRRHGLRAGALFRQVRAQTSASRFMGLELDELVGFADRLTRRPSLPYDEQAAVEVVFPARLMPLD